MLLKIYPSSINQKHIQQVVDALKKDGVVIVPTDTVYAFAASIQSSKGVETLCKLKGIDPSKANLSVSFNNLSQVSEYTTQVNNIVFRVLKKALPGPYTFILEASRIVPKIFNNKKKTIGIRIPNNEILQEIIRKLDAPIVTASVHDNDEIIDYTTDPELIYERYQNQVEIVIDADFGNNVPSTIIDCSSGTPEVLREGLGSIDNLF